VAQDKLNMITSVLVDTLGGNIFTSYTSFR